MLRLGTDFEVAINAGGYELTAIYPPLDSERTQKTLKKFARMRRKPIRGDQKRSEHLHECRVWLFRNLVKELRGVGDAEGNPLDTSVKGWWEVLPEPWITSWTNPYEEQLALKEDEKGN